MGREITVRELRELLEDEAEDAVVRIMHQQSWPLQETLGGIVTGAELQEPADDDDAGEESTAEPPPEESIVYLVADGQIRDNPYGSKRAWERMRGW